MTGRFRFTPPYKTIYKKTSPYLEDHPLIRLEKGGPVLVAVSGGQDSVALLHFLAHHPLSLRLIPCMIDYGFPEEKRLLTAVCRGLGLDLHLIPARRGEDCYECSRERKKMLFEAALEREAAVIFLGHHGDDLLESFFLSLLYGGEIHTFRPVESFHDSFLLVRPFSALFKKDVASYSRSAGLPLLPVSSCPNAQQGKREEVRRLLQAFSGEQKSRLLSTLLRTLQTEKKFRSISHPPVLPGERSMFSIE